MYASVVAVVFSLLLLHTCIRFGACLSSCHKPSKALKALGIFRRGSDGSAPSNDGVDSPEGKHMDSRTSGWNLAGHDRLQSSLRMCPGVLMHQAMAVKMQTDS